MAVMDAVVCLASLVQAQSPSMEDHEDEDDAEAFTSSPFVGNCCEIAGLTAIGASNEEAFCSEAILATSRLYSSSNLRFLCSLNSSSKVATPIDIPKIVASAIGRIRPAISRYRFEQRSVV